MSWCYTCEKLKSSLFFLSFVFAVFFFFSYKIFISPMSSSVCSMSVTAEKKHSKHRWNKIKNLNNLFVVSFFFFFFVVVVFAVFFSFVCSWTFISQSRLQLLITGHIQYGKYAITNIHQLTLMQCKTNSLTIEVRTNFKILPQKIVFNRHEVYSINTIKC